MLGVDEEAQCSTWIDHGLYGYQKEGNRNARAGCTCAGESPCPAHLAQIHHGAKNHEQSFGCQDDGEENSGKGYYGQASLAQFY